MAYLVDSFNEYGVPDLNQVPESSREPLEAVRKRSGWYYIGGSKRRQGNYVTAGCDADV